MVTSAKTDLVLMGAKTDRKSISLQLSVESIIWINGFKSSYF